MTIKFAALAFLSETAALRVFQTRKTAPEEICNESNIGKRVKVTGFPVSSPDISESLSGRIYRAESRVCCLEVERAAIRCFQFAGITGISFVMIEKQIILPPSAYINFPHFNFLPAGFCYADATLQTMLAFPEAIPRAGYGAARAAVAKAGTGELTPDELRESSGMESTQFYWSFPFENSEEIILEPIIDGARPDRLPSLTWRSGDFRIWIASEGIKLFLPSLLKIEFSTALPALLDFTVTDLDLVEKKYSLMSKASFSAFLTFLELQSVPGRITRIDNKPSRASRALGWLSSKMFSTRATGWLLYRRVDRHPVIRDRGCSVKPWLQVLEAAGFNTQLVPEGLESSLTCGQSFDANYGAIFSRLFEWIPGFKERLSHTDMRTGQVRESVYVFPGKDAPVGMPDILLELERPAPKLLIVQLGFPDRGFVFPLKRIGRASSQFPLEISGLGKKYRLVGTVEGDVMSQWVHISRDKGGERVWYSTYQGRDVWLGEWGIIDNMTQFVVYLAVGDSDEDLAGQIRAARETLKTAIKAGRHELQAEGVLAPLLISEAWRHIEAKFADLEAGISDFPDQERAKLINLIIEVKNMAVARSIIDKSGKGRRLDTLRPMTFVNLDGSCFVNAIVQALFSLPDIESLIDSIPDSDAEAVDVCKANHGGSVCASKKPFKKALSNLLEARRKGDPIGYLHELRVTLPDMFVLPQGGITKDAFLIFRERIPAFKNDSLFLQIRKDEIAREIIGLTDTAPATLIFWLEEGSEGVIPLSISKTGGSKYDLISTIAVSPKHVWANVRVSNPGGAYQWYALNNDEATEISPSRVLHSQTGAVVYRLVNPGEDISGKAEDASLQVIDIPSEAEGHPAEVA